MRLCRDLPTNPRHERLVIEAGHVAPSSALRAAREPPDDLPAPVGAVRARPRVVERLLQHRDRESLPPCIDHSKSGRQGRSHREPTGVRAPCRPIAARKSRTYARTPVNTSTALANTTPIPIRAIERTAILSVAEYVYGSSNTDTVERC